MKTMREKTKYLKYLLIGVLLVLLGVIVIIGKGKKENKKEQEKQISTTTETTTEQVKEKTEGT